MLKNGNAGSWRGYYDDGEKFLKAATVPGKKRVFGAEIVYNVLCMAVEKYFMAFFVFNKTMPDNHTMKDLVESAERIAPVSVPLKSNMLFLDEFQNICAISSYKRIIPDAADMERIIRTGFMAKEFADNALNGGGEKERG
jgi:hypothetical protein